MTLMLLVAMPLILIPHDCLLAWGIGSGKNRLSPHQLDQSSVVLALLGVSLLLAQPLNTATRYMVARGRPATIARILLLLVLVNVAISVALAEIVGVWGVAVGTIVAQIGALAIVPVLVARSSDMSLRTFATSTLRPVLPASVAGVVVFGIARTFHPDTKLQLLFVGIVWLAIGSAAIWIFGLGSEDRSAILRNVGKKAEPPVPVIPGASDPLP